MIIFKTIIDIACTILFLVEIHLACKSKAKGEFKESVWYLLMAIITLLIAN